MRMKFACAIKLRNLSQMPEVMTGPLVEHVRERYRAEFRMDASAPARGGGEARQQRERRAARARKNREIFAC